MSDFNAAGYTDLREYLASASGWDYFEVRDDTGSQVTRFSISGDSRATWTENSANPLTLEVTLSGSDGDIPTGTTLSSGALYDGSAGSEMHSGAFAEGDATIGTSSDEVIVTYTVELPQQA